MNTKRNTGKSLLVGLGILLFLGWAVISLIAWCPSGQRKPRPRPPLPDKNTPGPSVGVQPPQNTKTEQQKSDKQTDSTLPTDKKLVEQKDTATVVKKEGIKSTTPIIPKNPSKIRPSWGSGLQPELDSLIFSSFNYELPMWENWWGRNRLHYLPFKEVIKWNEINGTGTETLSISIQPRRQIFNTLIRCLKEDKNPIIRANAALALGKFKDKTALVPLKYALANDESEDVKNVVLLALGILEDESVISDLNAILTDKTQAKQKSISRAYAALALGYLKTDRSVEALKTLFNSNMNGDKDIQCSALLSLGNTEDKSLVPFLGSILNDSTRNEQVRAYAALALGRIKDSSALPELRKAMQDHKISIRASIAIALGLIKSPDSKNDLVNLLNTDKSDVRAFAVISLAQLGDKSAYQIISNAIQKGDCNFGGMAILALGLLGDERALPELREIAEKRNQLSYEAAILALGLLKDKASIPMIIKIVEKEELNHPILWNYAVQALGMIGDPQAIPALEKAFQNAQQQYYLAERSYNNLTVALAMLGKRKEIITILNEKLKDNSLQPEIKARILHGLAYLGDKSSIKPIIKTYEESIDDYTRDYATFALGYIMDKNKVNPLYRITADNNFNIDLNIIDHIFVSRLD